MFGFVRLKPNLQLLCAGTCCRLCGWQYGDRHALLELRVGEVNKRSRAAFGYKVCLCDLRSPAIHGDLGRVVLNGGDPLIRDTLIQ